MSFLNGLRVIEVSSTPRAGFCGKMLVDSGAEVFKLSLPGPYTSEPFSPWLDRGKSSVVIDWRTTEGKGLMTQLLSAVDVLISDRESEGSSRELAAIATGFPQLVHVSTSDLGHAGPYADRPSTDLTVAALSGICYINGEAGSLPLREPGNQTSVVAGIAAYLGVLSAIINRSQTAEGQTVEVSALEAMVNVLSPSVLQSSYQNGAPHRHPSADGFLFDCADGKVSIIISAQRSWDTILELWDINPPAEDAHKFTEQERRKYLDDIRALFAPVLVRKTRREVFEELCTVHIPCGMLLSPSDLVADPHLAERQSFDVVEGSLPGKVFPGPGFRIAGERPGAERPLPTLGAQTASLLAPLAQREVRA